MIPNCCQRIWESPWFRSGLLVFLILIPCIAVYWFKDVQNKEVWLLAYAAFLASMTTLFGKRIVDRMFAPKLKVDYVHGETYVDTPILRAVVEGRPVAADCYYFSLRVSNAGHSSADSVEVFATNLHKCVNQNWTLVRRYAMDLRWAWLGVGWLPTLAPKMDRFCNIGHIVDPAERANFAADNEDLAGVGQQTAILSLDLEARPSHGVHLLEPGKYRLTIQLVAANHKPITSKLEIEVTGRWHPNDLQEMVQDGIRIRLLEEECRKPKHDPQRV